MLIDLHVHTTAGSADSSLAPETLIEEARRLGIDGVCVTEHSGGWTDAETMHRARDGGLAVYQGREIETDVGHVLAIGMPSYPSGMGEFGRLAAYCADKGAALVIAHPFRHHVEPSGGQRCLLTGGNGLDGADAATLASGLPILSRFDAIETGNGANREEDDILASDVAGLLGAPTTGGSDAHSVNGIGRCATRVDGSPRTVIELAEAIRSGSVKAVSAREMLQK